MRGPMKEIIAVIRPEKWQATMDALSAVGVEDTIQRRVTGRGRQQGLQYLRRAQGAEEASMSYLPKRLVTCLVEDQQVPATVEALIRANQSGNYGDGKIFVCPLEG